jgi:hypothetical protein
MEESRDMSSDEPLGDTELAPKYVEVWGACFSAIVSLMETKLESGWSL